MARLEEELFISLKSGETVFKFIPEDIGEIVYCDSTNPKAEADSKEKTRDKIILSILIPLAIIVFCWLVFNSPVLDTIVTVVMLVIGGACVNGCLHFTGKDYFVGTEGAVIAFFKENRNNIVEKTVMYFRDFDDFLVTETRIYKNRAYQGTDYLFVVYGHEVDDKRHKIASKSGTYHQEKPKDYYEDREFRFWKKVETSWSTYRLSQLKVALSKGNPIGFNIYLDNHFHNNYIVFHGKEITIGDKVYNSNNVKNIKFNNGNLIIEDVNHSTKFFGLIEKGDKSTVPLNAIGNRELFLTFFQYFASTL